MKLFKYEGYTLKVAEEALTLKPFKKIWDRDKSATKNRAMQELAFIYFMEDPRSDYQIYIDAEERKRQIKLGEGLKDNWEPDKAVIEAMEFYGSFKTASALLLSDIKNAINILRSGLITQEDLANVEIEKRPKLLDSYSNVISKLTKLTKEVDEAERALANEIMQNDKVRGSAEKAIYEDI